MITIDGSYGEGGGQILRTALALSLVTGKPFTINNVRSGRKKSGLMRQHLTAVNAASEIGNATVTGNSIGSTSFCFEPGSIRSGNFQFSIGSAGSCTLVLQALIPALITAAGPSEIVLEGGTHNPFAPSFDFLDKAFFGVINRMGPTVTAVLERPGFFPAGGGRFAVSVTPSDSRHRLELIQRGRIIRQIAHAAVSNLPVTIATRELKVVREKLGWSRECLNAIEVENAKGPGNVLTLEVESEYVTEVFTGFGERGVPAETVAGQTVKQVREYLAQDVPVGRYLADQLLVPMAMSGGGRFRTLSPSRHTTTNAEIIKQFLKVAVDIRESGENLWEIRIG